MKKRDCPHQHHKAYQALLELMCAAGPKMQPYKRLEHKKKLHGRLPNMQKSKNYFVN